MRVMINSSQIAPATSQREKSFPCSIVQSPSQDTDLHKLLQHEIMLQATALHNLVPFSIKKKVIRIAIGEPAALGFYLVHGIVSFWKVRWM